MSPVSSDHAFAISLANDSIDQYLFNRSSGLLSPNPLAAALHLPPGIGPRHLLIHPFHPMAFIAEEGNGTTAALVSACAYDSSRGTLALLASFSAIPQGADAKGFSLQNSFSRVTAASSTFPFATQPAVATASPSSWCRPPHLTCGCWPTRPFAGTRAA